MSSGEVEKIKYFKPAGFKGRGNAKTYKRNRWHGIVYDKENNTFKEGKYPSKEALIEGLGLNVSPDVIYRIVSGNRVDTNKTKKSNSFIARYGHIKITKIDEPAELSAEKTSGE